MDKPTIYKLLRCLVCLILVCCILINCSPVRSKASSVITGTAITGMAALAWTALSAAGVVFIPKVAEDVEVLADSLQDYMDKHISTDEEWEEYKQFVDNMNNNFFSDPDADGPGNKGLLVTLSKTLLGLITGWIASAIINHGLEVEEESEAPVGYAYYNGILLPTLPSWDTSIRPYAYIEYNNGTYYLMVMKNPLYSPIESNAWFASYNDSSCFRYQTSGTEEFSDWTSIAQNISVPPERYIWSNHDVLAYDKTVFFSGTDPVYVGTQVTTIEPSTYIGDIPQQVQDGTMTAEDIVLPETINLGSILKSPETVVEDIANTSQQLADGTITYNDYITNITYNQTTDPDEGETTDPTTGTDPDPGTDPDTGTDTEKEVGDFTLDLTNYFPFCIPFDLYDFFACLNADPVTPVIEWEIYLPGGDVYPLTLDLSPFDSVAQLLRRLELLLFCVGLAFKTRDLIKG